jgi:hypothetical protein
MLVTIWINKIDVPALQRKRRVTYHMERPNTLMSNCNYVQVAIDPDTFVWLEDNSNTTDIDMAYQDWGDDDLDDL